MSEFEFILLSKFSIVPSTLNAEYIQCGWSRDEKKKRNCLYQKKKKCIVNLDMPKDKLPTFSSLEVRLSNYLVLLLIGTYMFS